MKKLSPRQESERKIAMRKRIGFLIMGILAIPAGLVALFQAIENVRAGNLAIGYSVRGVETNSSFSRLIASILLLFTAILLIWRSIQSKNKKDEPPDNHTSS
jgi:uncharacterized membrane protein HdeD (DUF308 family)